MNSLALLIYEMECLEILGVKHILKERDGEIKVETTGRPKFLRVLTITK